MLKIAMSVAQDDKHIFLRSLLYNKRVDLSDKLLLRQLFFINTFSFLGFLTVCTFGYIHILQREYFLGVAEFSGGIIFLFNILVLRFFSHITTAKVVMISVQGVLLILQLIGGGIDHTGIYWYFTFPCVVFFLTGRQKGSVWTALLYVATAITIGLSYMSIIPIAYSVAEVRQLLISLVVVCSLVYLYQYAVEDSEKKVASSANFLDSIVENIPHIIEVKDASTFLYVRVNKAAEIFLGKEEKEIIGKSFGDFYPREAEFTLAKDREAVLTKQLIDIPELEISNPAEKKRIFHTKKILIHDLFGKPLYVLSISEDITDKKQTDEKLAFQTDQLQRLNKIMVGREIQMIELKEKVRDLIGGKA